MATEILAVGATAANSADVVVAAGTPLTVGLKDTAGPAIDQNARVELQLKDDAGLYFTVDSLTASTPGLVIAGAGTYRFSRSAGVSCGVFSA